MRDTIAAPRTPFVMALASMLLLVGLFGAMAGSYGAVAWIFAAFFAASPLALLVPLVRRERLVLTGDRFEFRAAGRHRAVAWRDVERFGVVRRGFRYVVGIRFAPGRGAGADLPVAAGLDGEYGGVIPGWYGLRADDLADVLEERPRRAISA